MRQKSETSFNRESKLHDALPSADKRISKLCKARGGDNPKGPPAAAAVALRAELGGTGNDKDARLKIHLLPLRACANSAAQQL